MGEVAYKRIVLLTISVLLILGTGTPLSAKKSYSEDYIINRQISAELIQPFSSVSRYKINETTNSSSDPASIAKEYLVNCAETYGGSVVVDGLELVEVVTTKASVHVRFRQMWQGIPVYSSGFNVSMTPESQVSMVVASFVRDVNIDQQQPLISGDQAKNLVHRQVGGGMLDENENPVELMIYRDNEEVDRLVQVVNYPSSNPQGDWEVVVDARTSEFLKLRNTVLYLDATGKIFHPDPLSTAEAEYGDPGFEDNDDGDSDELNGQLISVTLRDITHDAVGYHLNGPFVRITDFDAPFIPPVVVNSDTGFSFTRSQNGFEAVNAYFHIDAMQRYVQELGIDNLQNNPIDVDVHAVNGADMSYYSPTLNVLAFGDGGVDDAEDADVIIHEYGHALHYAAVSDLVSNDMRSVSEGISDFLAGSYSAKQTSYNSDRVFNWDGFNPFFEGRMLNSDGIYPDDWTPWDYYINGSIWANALWRIHSRIEPDSADALILHSMFYQGPNGSVLDAAESLLQAEADLYDGRYRTAVYESLVEKGFLQPTLSVEPIELFINLERNSTLDTSIVVYNRGGQMSWVGEILPPEEEPIDPMTPFTSLNIGWNSEMEQFAGVTVMEDGFFLTAIDAEQDVWLMQYNVNGDITTSRQLDNVLSGSFTSLTNDGELIYGISDNQILGLTPEGDIGETIALPVEVENQLTYQPGEDVFWVVKNDSTIVSLDRLGMIQDTLNVEMETIIGLTYIYQDNTHPSLMISSSNEGNPVVYVVEISSGIVQRRYFLPEDIGRISGSDCGVYSSELPNHLLYTTIAVEEDLYERLNIFLMDWHFSYVEVGPLEGVIPSNSNDTIPVHISSENLEGGLYDADIYFYFEELDDTLNVPFKLNVITVGSEESNIPRGFKIGSAYPNPFNSSVKVEMVLPETMDLNVEIFNILGQRVFDRDFSALRAGRHQLSWQADSQLSSGMYLLKIKAEGYSDHMQKILLIR